MHCIYLNIDTLFFMLSPRTSYMWNGFEDRGLCTLTEVFVFCHLVYFEDSKFRSDMLGNLVKGWRVLVLGYFGEIGRERARYQPAAIFDFY